MKREVLCVDPADMAVLFALPPGAYIAGVANQINEQAQIDAIRLIAKRMGPATPFNEKPEFPLVSLALAAGHYRFMIEQDVVVGDDFSTCAHISTRRYELDSIVSPDPTAEIARVEAQIAVLNTLLTADQQTDCETLLADLRDTEPFGLVPLNDTVLAAFVTHLENAADPDNFDPPTEYRAALALVDGVTWAADKSKDLYRGIVWDRWGYQDIAAAFWRKMGNVCIDVG